jgi:hypothetical protein
MLPWLTSGYRMPENRGPPLAEAPLMRSGREWPIPCHIATRPVAVTSAVLLPAAVSRLRIPCHKPRRATHDRAGGPPATSEQALAMAAAAFLVLPSLTRCSSEWRLTRLAHELNGDRSLSAVAVAVTGSRNADAHPQPRKMACGVALALSRGNQVDARPEENHPSEAGGRVGVCPGLLRRPPSSESHGGAHSSSRLAPMTPTQASQRRTSRLVSVCVAPSRTPPVR